VTDDTRDRDRPFVGAGGAPETTGDEQSERSPAFGRADGTPAGTAGTSGSTRSTGERPAVADADIASEKDPNIGANPERDGDRVEERLRAVERALTGTDDAVADLSDGAAASAEREELSTRLDDLEARVEELEAATQAIRGYVGSIRSVNQAVERRADLALAKASENEASENGEATHDGAANENALDTAVPSDDALDAAVPSDDAVPTNRRRENGARSAVETATDRSETNDEKADDSWRSGALDRLRDSL